MALKIAILGWGSLLWWPHADFDAQHGEWNFDGPQLPVEFTRVAPPKMGGLTLTIDPVHGAATRTAYCFSKRTTAAEARRDLAEREWCRTIELIGCVELDAAEAGNRSDAIAAAIASWAADKNVDAVIWTAYPRNFREKTGAEFSVAAAIAYLKTLSRDDQERAARYIRKAPDFVHTPLRRALLAEDWFNRLAEELAARPHR